MPEIAGAFGGTSFHSAAWDHSVVLYGKRVGIVGTGASAIQFVPALVSLAASVHLFQRSAPHVIYKPDCRYGGHHQTLVRRVPLVLTAERLAWYLLAEYGQSALTRHHAWLKPWAALSRLQLALSVADRAKRAALTPKDDIGCRRLLFSNDYYRAVADPRVELVVSGIELLAADGVRTLDGQRHQLDALIYATGFQPRGLIAPLEVIGRSGARLAEDAWPSGASAFLGITVPRFPNMFLLYGPNTNLGSGSIVYMLESAARYVAQAVSRLVVGEAFDLRPERLREFDAEMQRRLAATVWASGCRSWYVDENGRNANNWPGLMREYRRRTARFDPSDYALLRATSARRFSPLRAEANVIATT